MILFQIYAITYSRLVINTDYFKEISTVFQFTLIDQWIDPCAFNKNVWLDYVAVLETGMEFIDLNFRLFQLFVSLYIEQFFPNLINK